MRALVLIVGLAACAHHPYPLAAQTAVGTANTDPGGVLVFSSQCADMTRHCPHEWSPAVDAIVTTGLAFKGYATIDPGKLRKDEARRTEETHDATTRTETHSHDSGASLTAAVIIPVVTLYTSHGSSITLQESHEKTVVIDGATLEDLTLPDRRALMELAGARSTLTTQITVGANWSAWTQDQRVEVMVKLSDAADGSMRWSARCAASSTDFPSPAAAVEAAAHCVVDALSPPRG